MRTFFGRRRKRKMTAAVALVMALLVAAFAAWAYFLGHTNASANNTGGKTFGSGAVCLGQGATVQGGCNITTQNITPANPAPGTTLSVTFEIDEQTSGNVGTGPFSFNLLSPNYQVTSSDSTCNAAINDSFASHSSWFTNPSWSWTSIQQPTSTGTGTASSISGTGVQTLNATTGSNNSSRGNLVGTLTLTFADTGTDQSACAGKDLQIAVKV
jgi:hypothetical protein